MNVYLVQHAQARKEQENPERPLSDKGLSDIKKVAAFISKNIDITIHKIHHSGKTRARQTAEVLADALHRSENCFEAEGLKPLNDPSFWAERLARETENIMLVGHLPHLSKLASLMLCQDSDREVVEFQMGGVVCIGKQNSENWSVQWMIIPECLP